MRTHGSAYKAVFREPHDPPVTSPANNQEILRGGISVIPSLDVFIGLFTLVRKFPTGTSIMSNQLVRILLDSAVQVHQYTQRIARYSSVGSDGRENCPRSHEWLKVALKGLR